MKINSKYILKVSILLLLISTITMSTLWFLYDKGKPQTYQPQLGYKFLQAQIERINSIGENSYGETTMAQDGVKGIIVYSFSKNAGEEIQDYFKQLSRNEYDGVHYTFPDDSREIYVGSARYTPMIESIGYGWWSYEGNIYAMRNGKTAAEGKPNYRNYFSFTIRKNDELFSVWIYCNTSNAEKALSVSIDCINKLV